jgi:hypothetical protein
VFPEKSKHVNIEVEGTVSQVFISVYGTQCPFSADIGSPVSVPSTVVNAFKNIINSNPRLPGQLFEFNPHHH